MRPKTNFETSLSIMFASQEKKKTVWITKKSYVELISDWDTVLITAILWRKSAKKLVGFCGNGGGITSRTTAAPAPVTQSPVTPVTPSSGSRRHLLLSIYIFLDMQGWQKKQSCLKAYFVILLVLFWPSQEAALIKTQHAENGHLMVIVTTTSTSSLCIVPVNNPMESVVVQDQ